MSRRLIALTLALLLALPVGLGLWAPGPVSAQNPRFFLNVVGDNGEAITSGRCRVLSAGTRTDMTIYSEATLTTTKTNPLTLSTTGTALGQCDWYMSASSADVIIVVDDGAYKGSRVRVDAVTATSAKRVVVNRSGATKVLMVPFPASASLTPTVDSRTLPVGAIVNEIVAEITTAVANSALAVGIGGGTAGLCNGGDTGIWTSATGFERCRAGNTALPQVVHTASAFRLTNQNHATAGYLWIYYHEGVND